MVQGHAKKDRKRGKMLRRLGNKKKLAPKIQTYFPPHNAYIELFFGAGGMFFNKPRARHNFVNDIDNDVYNLFMVLKESPDELYEKVQTTPYHESMFKHWVKETDIDPIWQAVRFLYLSNFSFLGAGSSLLFNSQHSKKVLLKDIKIYFEKVQDVKFLNCDFRKVLSKIAFRLNRPTEIPFIYADPPYLSTGDNYSDSFTKADSIGLFDVLCNSGIKFAMSEFKNEVIMEESLKRGLNVIEIGERQTMKNRNIEILVTNYELNQGVLF